MRTPRHPLWLLALATALSFTSGHRSADLLGLIDLMNEDGSRDGAFIGATAAPFLVVPAMGVISAIILTTRVPGSILLFQKSAKPLWKRILWSLLFGSLALISFMDMKIFSEACGYLLAVEDFDLLPDAAYNLMATLGWIYLWLSYRAIACYLPPAAKQIHDDVEVKDGAVAQA